MKNWILAIVLILVFALPTFAANPRRQARQMRHAQPVRNFVQQQSRPQLPLMPVRNFILNHVNTNSGGSCPGGICR